MAQVSAAPEQIVATQPPMPEWMTWVTFWVKDEPTVLVVILLMVAIGWLVKRLQEKDTRLGKVIEQKDETIAQLRLLPS